MGTGKQKQLPALPLTDTGISLEEVNKIMKECGHRLITKDDVVYINKILLWIANEFETNIGTIQIRSRKPQYVSMRFLAVYALIPYQRVTTCFIGALLGRKWCDVSHMCKEEYMDCQRNHGFHAEKFSKILPLVEGNWDQMDKKNGRGQLIIERVQIKEVEVVLPTKASDLRLFGERLLLTLGHRKDLHEIEKCLEHYYPQELAAEKALDNQCIKIA